MLFRAAELGLDRLRRQHRQPRLDRSAQCSGRKPLLDCPRRHVRPSCGHAADTTVRLDLAEGGSFEAALVVAADGRGFAGAWRGRHRRAQLAVSAVGGRRCSCQHSRAHDGVTTELHRRAGPLTTVPLPGNMSSLVWVENRRKRQRLGSLSDRPSPKRWRSGCRVCWVPSAASERARSLSALGPERRPHGLTANRAGRRGGARYSARLARRASTWVCATLACWPNAWRMRARAGSDIGGTASCCSATTSPRRPTC